MLKDKNTLLEELKHIKNEKSLDELFEFMQNNIESFFSTPDIPVFYIHLKDIDYTSSKGMMPKLIIAWMAFLSGDNANLFFIMSKISETQLEGLQDSSMFYALKSLVDSMMNRNDALRYAKLSLDILPQDEHSLYMANAKLTYGQLLSNNDQYRLAAEMFFSSYKIFYSLDLHFLAMIALVNELLNRYTLGEFTYVIDKSSEILLMSGSFKEQVQDYWNVAHLPLGMCYYEMNKPNLAIKHLKLSKKSIDKIDLLHMHGLIEMYLFKSYYILGDNSGMDSIKNETITIFGHMNYNQIDLLISMFNIFSSEYTTDSIVPDIEKFEIEYFKGSLDGHSIVMDVLVFLKLKGHSDLVKSQDLQKRLEMFKYTGNITKIQMTQLQLAELCLLNGKLKEANDYMKEAVQIYKEYGISACFYTMPLKSLELIKKIDKGLYELLTKNSQKNYKTESGTILSDREKQIMKLISLGKTNDEISKELFISVGTIKWHINNIFGKLQVKNRIQAIEKAKSLKELI